MTKKGSEGAVFIFGETSALNALDLGWDIAHCTDELCIQLSHHIGLLRCR